MTVQQTPGQTASRSDVKTKRRLDYIDAVRGLACFWVLLHHSFAGTPAPKGALHYPLFLLVHFSDIGWLGVSLFLVLSGFCLFYPLASRNDLDKIRLDVATFAKRRAWRILPPYYAAIILLVAVEVVSSRFATGHWDWSVGLHSPKDVLFHLLMLHNLSTDTISSVNGAFWSLALECQLYVIFPVLVWCAARYGLKFPLIATFLIAVAWQSVCFHYLGFSIFWSPRLAVFYHALPGRCFEFAAGMAAAYFVARPQPGQSRIALALLLIPLLPALYFVIAVSRFGPLCDQVWGVIFAASLVLLSSIPNIRFEKGLLQSLVWLGAISYSVYLLHQPLIGILSPQLMHLPAGQMGKFVAGFIRLPFLIAFGYLFHLAFERPFMPGRPRTERQAETAAIISPAP